VTPRLSPAYDIVMTSVYIQGEKQFALNLAKTKAWHQVTFNHFQSWSEKSGVPWRAIKPYLDDVMTKARALWPDAITHLPMNEDHKVHLIEHWESLPDDFRIG
jgi:serine/threonine-protein kinase HipA